MSEESETLEQLLSRYVSEETYSFSGFSSIDVNTRGHEDETPLHMAVTREAIRDAELLIAGGADVNARTDIASTPLHRACYTRNLVLVKLLVEAGASIDAADNFGNTPLGIAKKTSGVIHAYLAGRKA